MRRLIRLYYGFQFFFSLLLWLPIFYEFQHRIGLSDHEIFWIQSFYYTVFCFMEIPTGVIADIWGCRRCLRLGAVTLVVSNLLPIFAQNYWGFAAHFFLIALSRSFISGASSAYLYEQLAAEDKAGSYKQIEGNARAYGLIGKVVCWSFIGVLMEWKLTLPYWLTVVSAAISVVYAWRLPESAADSRKSGKSRKRPSLIRALVSTVRELAVSLVRAPTLLLLMLQGVAIFVLARICQVNLFQPILGAQGFSLATYGAVMSLMTVFEAIGSARPGWMRRYVSDLNAVFVLTLIMGATLALIPLVTQAGTLALLCVFSLATGLSFPIQRQLLNDVITDSSRRATLLSVESIIDRAVCAAVAPVMGAYLGHGELNSFLMISGFVTGLTMAVLFVTIRFAPLLGAREIQS